MQYDESGDAVGPLCAADGKLWRGPFAFFDEGQRRVAEAETSMAGTASERTGRAWLDARTFMPQEVGTIKKLGGRISKNVVIFNNAEYKRVMGKAKAKRHSRCVTLSVPSEETNVMELMHAFERPTCPHRELEVFAEFDARSDAMVLPRAEHVYGEHACDILMIRLNQQQEKFGLSVLFGAGRLHSVD